MLVLSRKKAEQIQIGDNITITVLRVKGSAVQIGVDAPSHVKILRSELSFDPPPAPPPQATSARAAAPAMATAIADVPLVKQAAARPAPMSKTLSQSRQEMRLLDVNRPMPTALGDRATLADTLVFLG